MPLFTRSTAPTTTTSSRRKGFFSSSGHSTAPRSTRGGFFHRANKNRVAGGYKSALSNPNTTRSGRKKAKKELRFMGRPQETHVPFMTKVKRTLGIRSTPSRSRTKTTRKHNRLL
ncbi:hypothetical protein CVT24_003884 [Panaeolus cyanescens]|uniref:Uncharacterized protein n=1 Tax=Panaeolus cyanescens TaxID=181874 RepID=A0A409VV61_9AGAR|nr:hypothetical protein CVT24_003884 [Panaeolus cyanescens]